MYLFKYKLIIYFFISLSFLFLISCSKKTNNDDYKLSNNTDFDSNPELSMTSETLTKT